MQLFRQCPFRQHAYRIFFLFLLLSGTFVAAGAQSQTGRELQNLIAKANSLVDLSAAMPYELHAQIVVEPGSGGEQRGEITIYRDQENFRTELRLGDFRQIEVLRDGQRYVSRSRPYPLVGLDFLNSPGSALRLKKKFPEDATFSGPSLQTIEGVSASCYAADLVYRGKMHFCFDRATGAAVRASDYRGWQGTFSGYAPAGPGVFPQTIKLVQPHAPRHLELTQIRITSGKLPDSAFAAPDGARVFAACKNMTEAVAEQSSKWVFWPGDTEVYLYAIVEADGSVHDLKAFGGKHKWAEKEVAKLADKWHYTSARCNDTAVASELLLPLGLYSLPGTEYGANIHGGPGSAANGTGFYFDLSTPPR